MSTEKRKKLIFAAKNQKQGIKRNRSPIIHKFIGGYFLKFSILANQKNRKHYQNSKNKTQKKEKARQCIFTLAYSLFKNVVFSVLL